MLELLSLICKLVQNGIEKTQAIQLVVSTMPEKDKVQAIAYYHKQLSGD